MRYKHISAVCAYKDSPYLEQRIRSLEAQTIPSHIIIYTSTPSSYIDRLAWRCDLQVCVRRGESDIKDDWNFAYSMAEDKLVTTTHQDNMHHRSYSAKLLTAHRRYPDVTVFTTDYVIVKQGALITGDAVLWTKWILRTLLRFPQMNDGARMKKLTFVLGNPVCCPATAYHKAVLGEPFVCSEYSFALDWDNLARLAEKPGHSICGKRPLLYYRVHEGATTKVCIRDNRRFAEERETFCRFWPEPVTDIIMGFYKKAYGEYG